MPLIAMKGSPTRVLLAHVNGWTFELLTYADGSWGIRKGEKLIGVWEPSENMACLIAFGRLIGIDDLTPVVVVRKSKAKEQFGVLPTPTSLNFN